MLCEENERVMKRWIYYIVGLNLIAAAVVLNIRFDLGVAAFSSVMYAIAELYDISMGTASILCYLFFVVLQCVLLRRATMNVLLEIPLSFAFGILIDVYDAVIPEMALGLVLKFVCFALTLFVTAFGVFLCVKTDLVLTPIEGIVKTISDVFHLRFSLVKNSFDLSMVVVSALLCLFNQAPFYGIGIGTVLSAIFVGRIIKIYEGQVFVHTDFRYSQNVAV